MPKQRQSIYVTLQYRDALGAIEWLKSVLEFVEHEIHHGEGAAIAHAQLAFGTDLIMLGSGDDGNPQTVYVACGDTDAAYERAIAADAEVVYPLADTDYGSREFAVRDPEANIWAVGTYQPTT